MNRESGILYPIFSLPSKFGIGCFSREAFEFVDFLYKSGQGYWQILPVGPTGFGNSPYQPFSAFAGNPYFISPEALIEDGLLTWDECNSRNFGYDQERVDYGALYQSRYDILKIAYNRFVERNNEEEQKAYREYIKKEGYWLDDYALYMTIKLNLEEGRSWLDWEDEDLKTRDKAALSKAKLDEKDTFSFFCFLQYEFDRQLLNLRKYANEKNVKIIGDIPFYVSMDSSDAWSHPEIFKFDKDLNPTVVAGCPPDAFSPTGQRWGNPIYNWTAMKDDDYSWWATRLKRNYEFYDVIRIDHFHGFNSYYAIPFEDETAENGKKFKGPGIKFFKSLKKQLGELDIIAEDLGENTPENEKLLKDSGFPGMKILQYAFTSFDSCYVNHRHINNCVVYTGTHDNIPTMAWLEDLNEGQREFTRKYINSKDTNYGQFVWDLIREAYRSVADLCIIPIQDYLCKGRESRINTPGAPDGNWEWRMPPNFLSDDLARSIRELADTYSRIPKEPGEEDEEEEKEDKKGKKEKKEKK